jgi:chaperonin cofactor prefoldin
MSDVSVEEADDRVDRLEARVRYWRDECGRARERAKELEQQLRKGQG